MKHADAVYNALLCCYPAPFRQEYGEEMRLVFADQLREARHAGTQWTEARLWLRAVADACTIAPKEHVHVIIQDLRYAFVTMMARPGFAAVAVLSLALGIGANTAIFSLWHSLLHASLPEVREPHQLVMLTNPANSGMWSGREDGARSWLTYTEFQTLRHHATSFTSMMASQSNLVTWQARIGAGDWEEIRGRFVSGEFFDFLGAAPAVGDVFTRADDDAQRAVVVISDQFWRRRFAGRSEVLGTTISLGKTAVTVIGVAPRGFVGETIGQQPDLWVPMQLQPLIVPGSNWLRDTPPEKIMWLHVFGRLKPGVTMAQASAEANGIFRADLESFYGGTASWEARRREYLDQRLELHEGATGASATRAEISQSLTALLIAIGVLLVIACVNLANLLLARSTARRHEIAVRLALGASRSRIIRQLLTESLMLSVVGGIGAIGVASFLFAALARMVARADSRFGLDFRIDPLLLLFVVAATVAAGLLVGLLPAWQATRTGAAAAITEQSRGSIGGRGHARSGHLLVGVQLALSLPLLVGAGLLTRTVLNLQNTDLGFPSRGLALMRPDYGNLPRDSARLDAVSRDIQRELQSIPGIHSVGFSRLGVFSGGESSDTVEVEGFAPKSDDDRGSAFDVVSPGYFASLGVPMLRGREFLDSDGPKNAFVTVINEAFATKYFAGRDPLGLRVSTVGDDGTKTSYRVIGVAKNARTQGLRSDVVPRFFVAFGQRNVTRYSPVFLLRSEAGAAPPLAAVRTAVQRVAAHVPISFLRSLDEQMAPLVAQDRTTAQLALVFGCVALALAAIGLYGVLSYAVSARAGEIAIRMALGAQSRRVITMILRETATLVVGGLVVGGAMAYFASRLIESRLYGVAPRDPVTLAIATAALVLVALAAAYLPARRASRTDPILALNR
jgi:predicted permease